MLPRERACSLSRSPSSLQRVPMQAAFPEKEGPAYLTLRGQGGEEIAMAVMAAPGGTRVRASTLLFDQTVDRFFSTLPASSEPAA